MCSRAAVTAKAGTICANSLRRQWIVRGAAVRGERDVLDDRPAAGAMALALGREPQRPVAHSCCSVSPGKAGSRQ